MAYKTGILFGRITKINSYDGSVTIRLEKNLIENIPEMGTFFLEIEGKPVPFFISEYDYPGADMIRITFEDYNSPEKMKDLKGLKVFLTTEQSTENIGRSIPQLEGYTVVNDKKIIGIVREVIDNIYQMILNVVSPSGQEILIPLHDDLIVNIDEKKKIITMTIPEGLTELN
jgi:16S rRNA processing protein RimM